MSSVILSFLNTKMFYSVPKVETIKTAEIKVKHLFYA